MGRRLWAWEQIAPLLAYVEEDPTWQVVVGLRTLLRTLYSPSYALCTRQFRLCHALRADLLREHCCGESGSHYLLFLEEDCDTMLEGADACGVGLAAASGDVVESTNSILKKGYNGHSCRGGSAGKSAVEREAMVVQQVWECWFLTFDLPLLHYNTPHTAACTAASLLSPTPQAPSTHAPSATHVTLRRSMDAAELRKLLEESQKATLALVVCRLSAVVRVHIVFIIQRL